MKTLKEVQEFLNDIYNINRGGCGISALALYRWLEKNGQLNGNTKFVYLYHSYNRDEYLNNDKVLREKTGKPLACAHAGLLHKNNYLDSNGKVDISYYTFVHHVNEEDFILKSINNLSSWNDAFNREHISRIEKKLGIDLSDIVES